MKLSVTIEIDDRAPNEEYCGNNCKGFDEGVCHIFNLKLKDYSVNKIDKFENNTLTCDETREIHAWKRCEPCIKMFYSFVDEG
jgi:hypothetical protein